MSHHHASSPPSDDTTICTLSNSHNDSEADLESVSDVDTIHPATARRLFPRSTMGAYPKQELSDSPGTRLGSPSETTPLLSNPPVHPIGQHVDNKVTFSVFWEEFQILAKYSLPVFGTHVLEYSLIVVPVVSIGHVSTPALAAISLGSMTASVSGFSVIQGICSALDTLLPSAWTSPRPDLVGLWTQRMTVLMLACLIPIALIWLNAEPILLLLRQEPEVAHLASTYLRWVSLGLPAYAFNCISRRYFQSQGLFAIPTRIVFIVSPINGLLNYLLVWGPAPIRLGFIGAPISTAISFNLMFICYIIYGVFFVPHTAWCPISRNSFNGLGLLLRLGLGGVGQTASEWWAWELVTLSASFLGPLALATQSILLVFSSITFQAPFSVSIATAVRIGNLLGEQNAYRARLAAHTSIILALFISCISSTVVLIFRHSWGHLFSHDPNVIALVASILPLVSLFQVFDATSGVAGGVLRARGKQFMGAMINLSGYYVLGIPLAIFFAFKLEQGLHGLWIGLAFALVYCGVLGTWLCLWTDWDMEVQKVQNRLKEEAKMWRVVSEA